MVVSANPKSYLDEIRAPRLEVMALIALRYRLWLFLAALVGAAAAYAFVEFSPVDYTRTAVLRLGDLQTRAVEVDAALEERPLSSSDVDTEVEVLRSAEFLTLISNKLSLYDDPEFGEPLAELGDSAMAEHRRSVVDQLADSLEVERRSLTYAVEIQVTLLEAEKAALVANTIADEYIADQLQRQQAALTTANAFVEERIQVLRENVARAESRVETYRNDNSLIDVGGVAASEREFAILAERSVELNSQVETQRAQLAQVRSIQRNGGDLSGLSLDQTNALSLDALRTLREQKIESDRRVAELSARYSEKHPTLIQAQSEVADLAAQISDEVSRSVINLQNALNVTERRRQSTDQRIEEIRERMASQNTQSVTLRELESEALAARSIYEAFLNRAAELQHGQLLDPNARILSYARAAGPDNQPSLLVAGLVSVSLCLFLAGLGIAATESVNDGFTRSNEIEFELGAQNVGSIPRPASGYGPSRPLSFLKVRPSPPLFLLRNPSSFFAHSFTRLLRSLMADAKPGGPEDAPKCNIISITSSVQNEGKTTTALCLARTAAAMGFKTLLIDADIWRSTLQRKMGTRQETGVIDYLTASGAPEEYVRTEVHKRGAQYRLDVIPVETGKRRTLNRLKRLDVFSSQRMADLMSWARENYECVIIDTAPILAAPEICDLLAQSDTTVLAVRWKKTKKDLVELALKEKALQRTPSIVTLLTQVDTQFASTTGHLDASGVHRYVKDYFGDS